MNTLLGFIVLTGPLFFIVLWVPFCIFLAVLVGRKVIKKTLIFKISYGLVAFLSFLILPVADEIIGRIYFNHLCETVAGVKVHQTVELPIEYWDKDGRPKFLKPNTDLDMSVIEGFNEDWVINKNFSNFPIDESRRVLIDVRTQKTIGEVVTFRYWGGWLVRSFSPHNTAQSCGQFRGINFWREFYLSIFIPIHREIK